MINVGVIGAGPAWQRHHEALARLRRPVQVRAIYDVVPARAERAAKAINAEVLTGLSSFIDRPDISALLILDPGWMGLSGVELLTESGRPIFIEPWLPASAGEFESLFAAADERRLTMMPGLWRRFMPSAMRMQELIATQLGRLARLSFTVTLPDETSARCDELTGWLDFCRVLFRIFPQHATLDAAADESSKLRVSYPVPGQRDADGSTGLSSDARQAEITLTGSDGQPVSAADLRSVLSPQETQSPSIRIAESTLPQIDFVCEHGTATILDRAHLRWTDSDGETHDESLSSDRPESDVMLDLFFRRVVGGLIPVADYNDLARAMRLLEQAIA